MASNDMDNKGKVMIEHVFRGDEVESIVTEAQGIDDYNSVRFWVNGEEINPNDLEIVVYVDEEE